MACVQRKNSNFVAVSSCILVLLLLIALGFQPQSYGCPTGKTSWPELVGVVGCDAAATIKAENSAYNPVVIPSGTPIPRNYVCTRVFIYISGYHGLVSDTPFSG